MPTFSCIVLAGGRSSRMGQDKATLQAPTHVDLLTHMVYQAELAGAAEVIISRDPATTPRHLHHHQVIADEQPHAGPLGGLYSCLKACQHTHALVLPVDMPALPPHFLSNLVHAAQQQVSQAVYYDSFELPCVLPVKEHLLNYLHQALHTENARRSIRSVLAYMQAQAIPFSHSSARYFINTNTPDEWQSFLQGYEA